MGNRESEVFLMEKRRQKNRFLQKPEKIPFLLHKEFGHKETWR